MSANCHGHGNDHQHIPWHPTKNQTAPLYSKDECLCWMAFAFLMLFVSFWLLFGYLNDGKFYFSGHLGVAAMLIWSFFILRRYLPHYREWYTKGRRQMDYPAYTEDPNASDDHH